MTGVPIGPLNDPTLIAERVLPDGRWLSLHAQLFNEVLVISEYRGCGWKTDDW